MPLTLFSKHKHKKVLQSPSKSNSNLRPQTRGNKRSQTEEIKLKEKISVLSDNHSDHEIMSILSMPRSTYYHYKQKLYEEAREIWAQTYKESQSYRILHIINAINLALRVQKEIVLSEKESAKDRLEACDKLVELEMHFLKLISDMNEDKAPAIVTPDPRPTTYPTIPDPNNPGKWLTDPAWIESNIRNMKK